MVLIGAIYSMLEDKTISHLISWTPSAESFVMQPSHEFSKVLAYVSPGVKRCRLLRWSDLSSQYFKHTNISSFVRQLNMYGFHKGTCIRPLISLRCAYTKSQLATYSITGHRRRPCGSSSMEMATSSGEILSACARSRDGPLDMP